MREEILTFIKNELGFDVSNAYYSYVAEWSDWWRGYRKSFHRFVEIVNNRKVERDMFSLKMAKKICEDWASILLNEKTTIATDDENSTVFLMGTEEEQSGGVFGQTNFWQKANELVERAFYSGTGAAVIHVKNMATTAEGNIINDAAAQIELCWVDANNIIPLTTSNGEITEAAFVSEFTKGGKDFLYLETHTLKEGKRKVRNFVFRIDNSTIAPVELPEGVIPEITYNTDLPLFAFIKPNIVNHVDLNTGLGISIFADAIDNIKAVDIAFNNFCKDLKLGGKKVFINQDLTKTTDEGTRIAPDDVAQQLFMTMGDDIIDQKTLIQEYNPTLRTDEDVTAIQAQLDYLSFKCGLGTKHYQFHSNGGVSVTATQYVGDKQDMIQHAAKHYIIIERALTQLCKAILWVGKEICNQPVNPDTRITVTFDDSYIIDKESERQRDLQEVRDGIMQKWEYRVKWYGEDVETAKSIVTEGQGADFDPFNLSVNRNADGNTTA